MVVMTHAPILKVGVNLHYSFGSNLRNIISIINFQIPFIAQFALLPFVLYCVCNVFLECFFDIYIYI